MRIQIMGDGNVVENVADTQIRSGLSGTHCHRLLIGQPVRILIGALEGVEGVFTRRKSGGRVLVQIKAGVFVEIDEYCIEPVRKT